MPAGSPHEALLAAAVARLQALSLNGLEARVVGMEMLAAEWDNTLGELPCLVVSSWPGAESLIDAEEDSCAVLHAYPLYVREVDRQPAWDVSGQAARLARRRTIFRAFHGVKLTLDFAGVQNTDVLFLPSPVVEALPEGYQLLSFPLVFQANVYEPKP